MVVRGATGGVWHVGLFDLGSHNFASKFGDHCVEPALTLLIRSSLGTSSWIQIWIPLGGMCRLVIYLNWV